MKSIKLSNPIKDNRIIYQCMRTTLIEANNQKVNSILIPAFGRLTGKVPCETVAHMMFLAYNQIFNFELSFPKEFFRLEYFYL